MSCVSGNFFTILIKTVLVFARIFHQKSWSINSWRKNAFRNAVKFSSGSSDLNCNAPNLCKYHWGKLSLVIVQSLWSFLALWLPCRIDDDVEYAHNQSIICLIVCSTYGLCHTGMLSVLPPHYGIVNEIPVFGSRMHLWCPGAVW